MRSLFAGLYLLIFFAPFCAFAQSEKIDTSFIRRLKEEETDRSKIAEIAHQITDVCGPRLTNSPGYAKAVSWCTQALKAWGIARSGPEAWGEFGRGWYTDKYSLALTKPYHQSMLTVPFAWTRSTNGLIKAKVIALGTLDSAAIDKLGDSIRGKIVIVNNAGPRYDRFKPVTFRYADTALPHLPDDYMFTREMLNQYMPFILSAMATRTYLDSKGPLAVLTASFPDMFDGIVNGDGRGAYKKNYAPGTPEMMVAREDYIRILRLLTDKSDVEMEVEADNHFTDTDLTGYNVIGEIPGTDPKLKSQVVMLGGHLDSWHPATGATDNAAGCIVMMEVMRLLKTLGVQPRRTIRISLWGGEEQGLYGSFGYVKNHFGDPKDMKLKPEQKLISAYYNLDNGTGRIRGIYAQQNEKVKTIFEQWLAPFADSGAKAVTMSNTGSTDHLSFDAVGIPGFQFIQDPLDYESFTHHSNMDTYDHLVMDDLKQATIVVASFVYNTAMREEMIPRKPIPKAEKFVFDIDVPF